MKLNTLHDLLVDEVKDLYSAENQLTKALPKLAKAATTPELKKAFEHHLEQTRGHVDRIVRAAEAIEASPKGKKCVGCAGLIEEGAELLQLEADPDVRDAGLIGATQRVEHYEMAAYGAARAHAELLGYGEAVDLLQKTLDEEGDANKKLTEIAGSMVNPRARSMEGNGRG